MKLGAQRSTEREGMSQKPESLTQVLVFVYMTKQKRDGGKTGNRSPSEMILTCGLHDG
jgi:hypothetical protein